jgi:hypothetical protein
VYSSLRNPRVCIYCVLICLRLDAPAFMSRWGVINSLLFVAFGGKDRRGRRLSSIFDGGLETDCMKNWTGLIAIRIGLDA